MLNKNISRSLAYILLTLMGIMMFFSATQESAIMDELAHIPAAYSYLAFQDYRLNPEHPPFAKDIAAIPLLFLNLNFPANVPAWASDINGQWAMGSIFLYESGNDPDQILFWSRMPFMILALIFGWLIFKWTRGLYGDKVGLLTLFFFTMSPTFIAHSRYVTTDLAAAFAFFIGITTFLAYLFQPNRKTLVRAGIVLGVAQLLKFSLVLLIPLYVLLGALWIFLSHLDHMRSLTSKIEKLKHLLLCQLKMIGNLVVISAIGVIVIMVVYTFHIWNYPADLQIRDMTHNLNSFSIPQIRDFAISIANIPVLRPLAQYLHGLLMVIERGTHGNTTYFLGDISAAGWRHYFPVAYLLKEPLAFHILTLIALFLAIKSIIVSHEKSISNVFDWMRDNFALTAGIIFIAVYWLNSIASPLNIGVRHVLPTFPFIYLLVARELIKWTNIPVLIEPQNIKEWVLSFYQLYIKPVPRYFLIFILVFWMATGTIIAFPHYLPYYNELIGGTKNGSSYIVDSNYDWGQDLKRLGKFVEKNNIQKINLDYFGGGSPRYYLGDAFEPWWSSRGKPEGWFAISATFRQGAWGNPVKNFKIKPEDTYPWLRNKIPVARAGYSIFIYKLDGK